MTAATKINRRKERPEQEASDRYTERERPCARCGATFTTTPKQRLLCERCWQIYG